MIELKDFMYLGGIVLALGEKGIITEMPTNTIKNKEYVYSIWILIDGKEEPIKYHPDDIKEIVILPKDAARDNFNKMLEYSSITRKDIEALKKIVRSELEVFENAGFKMYLNKTTPYIHNVYKSGHLVSYSLRCSGIIKHENQEPITHFEDREAITFNSDGFIGFCGWADKKNSKPFIDAFNKWVWNTFLPDEVPF